MKIKNIILILKVSFLLSVFAAATFYFQYASLKKVYAVTSSSSKEDKSDKNSNTLPLAEEENENEKSSSEEEEQNDDRAIHHLELISFQNTFTTISLSTIHILNFKEIHFEIVTPPPQS